MLGRKLDQSSLVLYAFRYAIGRRTYANSDMALHILNIWEELDIPVRKLIQREIAEAMGSDIIPVMDLHFWEPILDLNRGDRDEK